LTDTLPSFPRWPAFPSSEYYDGSAPSAPVSRHRTYPPITRLAGAFAGAPDEWFPRSLLFGWRIRHPALPLRPRHGYAVDLHHGLPDWTQQTQPRVAHHPGNHRNSGCAPHTSPHPPG